MHSIFRLATANIRNRWKLNLAIGLSIAIAGLLLTSSLSLFTETDKLFENMFERQRASHLLLFFDSSAHLPGELTTWFERQPEVEGVSAPFPMHTIPGPLIFQGREIDKMMQLTEWQESNLVQDKLTVLEGEAKDGPGPGEIWLPQHFANTFGIGIGDTIGIPVSGGLYPLKVSATIIDPHYSSGMINPNRAWIAGGELSFIFPIPEMREVMLGVRLNDPGSIRPVWSRFTREINYNGRHFDYHFYKGVFMSFYHFAGAVLLTFAVLGLFAAIFLVSAALSGAIRQDFAVIGTLKALGMTPAAIRKSLLLQNLLLSFLFIPPGLLGAWPIVNAMLAALIRAVGSVDFQFSIAGPALISGIILFLTVGIWTFVLSGKAGRVSPVEAIRYGASIENRTKRKAFHPSLPYQVPPSLRLAVQFLIAAPGRSLATLATFLLSVFLLVLAANLTNSFTAIKENKPMWGFDKSDIQVSLNRKVLLPIRYREFCELLEEEEKVRGVFPYGYVPAKILQETGRAADELYGKAFAGDLDQAGLINLEGRHPAGDDEISLCTGTAQTFGKRPGDSIGLYIEGMVRDFMVTGIYQDVSNLGKGFRLHAAAMQSLNPLWEPDWFGIRLEEGAAVPDFKAGLQRTYGETINVELSIDEQIETMGIIEDIKLSMSIFATFFMLVFLLAVISDIFLFIRSREKELGIFKTVGYTPEMLRAAFSFRIIAISIVALITGIPLGLRLIPGFLGAITAGIGLVEFPFSVSVLSTLAILPLVIITGGVGAWIASGKVRSVSPKQLLGSL